MAVASSSSSKSTDYAFSETALAYCMRADSVKPCWARDVQSMPGAAKGDQKEPEYYLLGTRRVPVRSITLVGIVVGVAEYETRCLYSVDDGSSVVECVQTISPPSPRKGANSASAKPTPLPTFRNGAIVRVTGRIIDRPEQRQLKLGTIERLRSLNDQPKHWLHLQRLYREEYDNLDALGPWVVPRLPSKSPSKRAPSQKPISQTPHRDKRRALTNRQESLSDINSDHSSQTPTNKKLAIDPPKTPTLAKPAIPPSPLAKIILTYNKLSNPTRMKRDQLSEHTFRLYLSAYIERLPILRSAITASNSVQQRAISLSHLLRVPELIILAQRLVRQKDRERAARNGGTKVGSEPPERKIVKLFGASLRRLLADGKIVLSEEGDLTLPLPSDMEGDNSEIDWLKGATTRRGRQTQNLTMVDTSLVSTSTTTNRRSACAEIETFLTYLSRHHPVPEASTSAEEAYMFVCPEVLAPAVESAIRAIRKRAVEGGEKGTGVISDKLIGKYLRRMDARFEKVEDGEIVKARSWLERKVSIRDSE
ncbi:hypothetical protein DL96DRAFT_1713869 [Flagelloscypha sp. PMI_526]|nr:hypothetical protein DL96DRAFT_1713869 [Flagelloscypha sp. PMI_526]